MRVQFLFPCSLLLLLLGVRAAQSDTGAFQDGYQSRKLAQFGDQVLPEGFQIPQLTCERGGPYPYMASLRDRNGDHLCGGIVISSEHILTAAHCLDPRFSRNSNPRPLVHIGGWDRDNPIEKRATKAVIPHPEWRGDPSKGGDLAILTLSEPTCVKPIYKIATTLTERTEVEFLGYGRSSIGGTFSFLLQGGKYTFIPKSECQASFKLDVELDAGMICSKSPNSAGICVGDDGGPLVLRPSFMEFTDIVLGIASFASSECTDADGVSIFTNLKNYRKWILENSSAEEEKRSREAEKKKGKLEQKKKEQAKKLAAAAKKGKEAEKKEEESEKKLTTKKQPPTKKKEPTKPSPKKEVTKKEVDKKEAAKKEVTKKEVDKKEAAKKEVAKKEVTKNGSGKKDVDEKEVDKKEVVKKSKKQNGK